MMRHTSDPRPRRFTMSVFMTIRVPGDPRRFEEVAQANPERMERIIDAARANGLIHHRFFGRDGEILVLDEWESEEGFHAFFSTVADIPELMAEAGVDAQPEPVFWRALQTNDEV
jgi:hypothetical protein